MGAQRCASQAGAGWGLGRHVIGSNYFYYIRDPWAASPSISSIWITSRRVVRGSRVIPRARCPVSLGPEPRGFWRE